MDGCRVETIENDNSYCTAVPEKWVVANVLHYPVSFNELHVGRKKEMDPNANWKQMPCKILTKSIS